MYKEQKPRHCCFCKCKSGNVVIVAWLENFKRTNTFQPFSRCNNIKQYSLSHSQLFQTAIHTSMSVLIQTFFKILLYQHSSTEKWQEHELTDNGHLLSNVPTYKEVPFLSFYHQRYKVLSITGTS